MLNADTCNGNVSSIHQDCWSWQQSSVPWSVQSLKYSCLTMGLSKHKYLLLLLSPPPASNLYPRAQKPDISRPKCCCVLEAELPLRTAGAGVGREGQSGSLCQNLGRCGCDDKDTLITHPESFSRKEWQSSSQVSWHSSHIVICFCHAQGGSGKAET